MKPKTPPAPSAKTVPAAEIVEPINRHLGARVKQLRAERAWSLEALAAASGVSRSMLSQIEREQANPTLAVTHVATNRPLQPYTDQANFGFSKALGKDYAVEVDGVYARGRDLGTRFTANVRINGGARRFAGLLPQSGAASWRLDVMEGKSFYKGLNLAFKKRSNGKLSFTAWYSLSSSRSSFLASTDDLGYTALNAFDPFAENQIGPTRTDARHRVTINGTWNAPGGFRVSPIFRYKSKTPFNVLAGVDLNRDGVNFDLPVGVTTLNSARYVDFKQFDLRLARTVTIKKDMRFEVVAEGFNVTNEKNPGGFVIQQSSSSFGKPTTYAGDFQRGEQRLFQLGVRFEF